MSLRTIWRLIESDYRAAYAFKGEDPRRRRVLMLPRLLTNSSLHANVLVRLMLGSPRALTYLWRRILISSHGMDIAAARFGLTIGPGLELPHPVGIVIGASTRIGSNVVIHHGVSVGARFAAGSWQADDHETIVIGDGVTLYPYSHVQTDVGEGAVLTNHSVAVRPIPAGTVAAGIPARVVNRPAEAGTSGGQASVDDDRLSRNEPRLR